MDTHLVDQAIEKLLDEGLEAGLSLSEHTLPALYHTAYHFFRNGKYDKARDLFTLLTVRDIEERKYWMGLASCHQMLQNYQEAIECYSTAAHQDPLDPTAHWYAAQCYFSSGNLKMARVALESAITQAKKEEKHLKLLTQLELVHQIWTPTQEGLS